MSVMGGWLWPDTTYYIWKRGRGVWNVSFKGMYPVFCFAVNPCVLSPNRVDLGFFVSYISQFYNILHRNFLCFTPPPQTMTNITFYTGFVGALILSIVLLATSLTWAYIDIMFCWPDWRDFHTSQIITVGGGFLYWIKTTEIILKFKTKRLTSEGGGV